MQSTPKNGRYLAMIRRATPVRPGLPIFITNTHVSTSDGRPERGEERREDVRGLRREEK